MNTPIPRVVLRTLALAVAGLLFAGASCGDESDVVGPCEASRFCSQQYIAELDRLEWMCLDTLDPNSGCETINHANGTSSCGACNPNANVVSASLQTPGQCATYVYHSNTYETPGCWFNACLPWPADDVCWHDCFFWCGPCYTTDEWYELVYVPEPPFGGCP